MLAPRRTLWSTPFEALEPIYRWTDPVILGVDKGVDDADDESEDMLRISSASPLQDEGSAMYHSQTVPENGPCICDVGCGDGRIVLEWAKRMSSSTTSSTPKRQRTTSRRQSKRIVHLVGIDIDETRIQQCQASLEECMSRKMIDAAKVRVEFICGNALDIFSSSDQERTKYGWVENISVFFLYLIPRGLQQLMPLLQAYSNRRPDSTIHIISYMSKLPIKLRSAPTDRALIEPQHQKGARWPLYYYKLKNGS